MKNPKYPPQSIQPLQNLAVSYEYCLDVYKMLGELGSSAQVSASFLEYIQARYSHACARHESILFSEEAPSADGLPQSPGAQSREETLLEWYLDRYTAKLDAAAAVPAQPVAAS